MIGTEWSLWPQSASGGSNLGPLGLTSHRSLCHEGKLHDRHFLVPISRQDGIGDRCHVNLVAGNVGVCLPSESSLTEGPSEDKGGAVGDTPGGPMVTQEGMVSGPLGSECRASTVTTSHSKTTKAAKVKHVPSEPSGAKDFTLEVITKSVTSAGFSQGVAERIARGKL